MNGFVWTYSPLVLKIRRWGEMDFKRTTFEYWRIAGLIEPGVDYGRAVVQFSDWSLDTLHKWHCPPAIAPKLVDKTIQHVIGQFAGESEITYYPVECSCSNGISNEYEFLSPRLEINCVDFTKSDLKMHGPGTGPASILSWKRLVFFEGCLGNSHIAWVNQLPECIVVSEGLKNALSGILNSGIAFVRPEDYVKL